MKKEREQTEEQNEEQIFEGSSNQPRLLIIDGEEHLRNALKKSFSEDYNILEASNREDGFKLFMKVQPKVVCIGEHLSLLNEKMLAKKICKIKNDSILFFITTTQSLESGEKDLFD